MGSIHVNLFKFGSLIQMSFKDFTIFSSGSHFVCTIFVDYDHFCEIKLNLDQ